MLPARRLIIAVFGVCLLTALFEVSEARPHIRHQKDGSHCSRCGPGWGAVNHCVRGHDTECGKCAPGTYSPHHSTQPCWICSRCGPGLYEAHPCTSKTDTVCDSCHRPAPDNLDYRNKCKGRTNLFLAPEDAFDTAEQSILVNEPDGQDLLADGDKVLEKDAEAAIINGEFNSLERF
ncbi:tumor necrosis factor receptor superfamily member 4-like [Bombus bifarius]|uniref:Tumor necrosis factor receptor superfamily member 4-like n=1 Tax=Bombus bifarius TaxID=103933 RepID=A0A6P8MTK9_9HYME|nr:tumor necrosis factor receptor superfamily member 4-like [Bombus vancouverensis nearcticus]XP_033312109.1 tumor necrosis factor receptor superfamily member 4-like [Bombus bifarius]XP_050489700.1 tumor necrosis factor receptor superfamily member 4-like [Bombus huntii]